MKIRSCAVCLGVSVCLGIAAVSPGAVAAPETTKVIFLPPSAKPVQPTPFWTGPRIAASVMVVSGVSAIVVGAVYASRSDESFAALKNHCVATDLDICDATGYALRKQGTTEGRVGTTALGVGATAIFLGLALGWINPDFHAGRAAGKASSFSPIRMQIAPLVGSGQRGLAVIGAF